jgi:hypothetical protein
MKKSLFIFAYFIFQLISFGQKFPQFGSIHLNYGSVFVYSTKQLVYESPDLYKKNNLFAVQFIAGGGLWKASYTQESKGSLLTFGTSILLGKQSHFLEHNSSLNFHYGQSLKGNHAVFIGTLYRPYLGYRFQPKDKHLILKIGSGWKEIIQLGVGWRF